MEKVSEDKIRVDAWFGKRKDLACVRTVCSHIENMMNGVKTVSSFPPPPPSSSASFSKNSRISNWTHSLRRAIFLPSSLLPPFLSLHSLPNVVCQSALVQGSMVSL